jgi:hypothetical protein
MGMEGFICQWDGIERYFFLWIYAMRSPGDVFGVLELDGDTCNLGAWISWGFILIGDRASRPSAGLLFIQTYFLVS